MVTVACFVFILLLLKFEEIVLPKVQKFPKIFINENLNKKQENLVNFKLTFSNVQKYYQMEKPKFDHCNGRQIKLVVLVITRREFLQRRMGIRNSWAKDMVIRIF
ncbi:hypothetical protein ACQ4LE_007473 [Meloidogyne hapla]